MVISDMYSRKEMSVVYLGIRFEDLGRGVCVAFSCHRSPFSIRMVPMYITQMGSGLWKYGRYFFICV